MFNYINLIELFMKETFVRDLMGSRDAHGNTPFMICCGNGHNRILDMFIQAGIAPSFIHTLTHSPTHSFTRLHGSNKY